MGFLERYLDKRINELQRQVIKYRWEEVELQKTVDKIHTRSRAKFHRNTNISTFVNIAKAPSDMKYCPLVLS